MEDVLEDVLVFVWVTLVVAIVLEDDELVIVLLLLVLPDDDDDDDVLVNVFPLLFIGVLVDDDLFLLVPEWSPFTFLESAAPLSLPVLLLVVLLLVLLLVLSPNEKGEDPVALLPATRLAHDPTATVGVLVFVKAAAVSFLLEVALLLLTLLVTAVAANLQ